MTPREEFADRMRKIREQLRAEGEEPRPVNQTAVMLSEDQIVGALRIATVRQSENWAMGRKSTRGLNDENNWPLQMAMHIQGALGEVAFAAMHRTTAEVGSIGASADVGRVEVKTVMSRTHSLIVRRGTPADTPCALVFLNPPRAELLGWCVAGDVMLDEHVKDVGRGPQWFVPARALRAGPVPYHVVWAR